MLDCMQGSIWICDVKTGEPPTGFSVIDNDCVLSKRNKQCCTMKLVGFIKKRS